MAISTSSTLRLNDDGAIKQLEQFGAAGATWLIIDMHAYISRPIGTRDGIDFDRVNAALIRPALEQLAIDATEVYQYAAGSMQAEILLQLATADLVIADISGASPNVNFELGVRYAMRHRFTVLIQARNCEPSFHLQQISLILPATLKLTKSAIAMAARLSKSPAPQLSLLN